MSAVSSRRGAREGDVKVPIPGTRRNLFIGLLYGSRWAVFTGDRLKRYLTDDWYENPGAYDMGFEEAERFAHWLANGSIMPALYNHEMILEVTRSGSALRGRSGEIVVREIDSWVETAVEHPEHEQETLISGIHFSGFEIIGSHIKETSDDGSILCRYPVTIRPKASQAIREFAIADSAHPFKKEVV